MTLTSGYFKGYLARSWPEVAEFRATLRHPREALRCAYVNLGGSHFRGLERVPLGGAGRARAPSAITNDRPLI